MRDKMRFDLRGRLKSVEYILWNEYGDPVEERLIMQQPALLSHHYHIHIANHEMN